MLLFNFLKKVTVRINTTKIEIKSEIGAAYKIPLIPLPISFFSKMLDKIINFTLPPQIHGNYWIVDKNKSGKERNFINSKKTATG